MRWLGPSLVALALVFSTGGVAIVGHADSSGNEEVAQSQCPAPVTPRRVSGPSVPREPKSTADNKSIVLNTNGYNYPLDGQWHPDPVAQPEGVPDGVLPKAIEAK